MKKHILWLGMSFLLVAALVLASCGPAAPGEQEEEEEVVVPGEQEEEEEEGIPTLSIGETFTEEGVEVTVSEAVIADSYEYIDKDTGSTATKEASPGTFFIITHVAIKNVETATQERGTGVGRREGPDRMFVSDAEGNAYEAYPWSAEDAMEGVMKEHYDYILPGKTTSGKVVFIIPEEASGLKVFYKQQWPPITLAEWVIE